MEKNFIKFRLYLFCILWLILYHTCQELKYAYEMKKYERERCERQYSVSYCDHRYEEDE